MVSFIRIEGKIVKGTFVERPNRFLALVNIGGRILPSFLPNSGRLQELLSCGAEVVLRRVVNERRKTAYDLIGIRHRGETISVDSRVPNKLVREALNNKDLREFSAYNIIRPEYHYGNTRFDFFLSNGQRHCVLEVKSCTLVIDGVAMFPDAKTERGRRHVRDLVQASKEGFNACLLFIIQRTDSYVFSPNSKTDPEFSEVLRYAAKQGVKVYAYCCEFTADHITMKEKVRVKL